MRRRRGSARSAESSQDPPTSAALRQDAAETLAAFAHFQAVFASTATARASTSPLEVRLQLAETAADIARAGESLNILASLLELPERVPTISPEAAEAVVRAGRALRSERA